MREETHTGVTAVAYEEEGARIHGLDGSHLQHSLSWRLNRPKDYRVTLKYAAPAVTQRE